MMIVNTLHCVALYFGIFSISRWTVLVTGFKISFASSSLTRSINRLDQSTHMAPIKYEYAGVFEKNDLKKETSSKHDTERPALVIEESDEIKLTYQKVYTFGGHNMDRRKTNNKELKFLLGGKGTYSRLCIECSNY